VIDIPYASKITLQFRVMRLILLGTVELSNMKQATLVLLCCKSIYDYLKMWIIATVGENSIANLRVFTRRICHTFCVPVVTWWHDGIHVECLPVWTVFSISSAYRYLVEIGEL